MRAFKTIDTFRKLCEYAEEDAIDISEFPDTNTPTHSHAEKNLVERSIEQTVRSIVRGFKTHRSVLVYGDPGLGKTAVIKESANDLARIVDQKLGGKRKVVDWALLSVDEQRHIIDNNLYKDYFFFWDIRTAMLEPSDITGIIDIRSRKEYLEMKPQLYAYIMGIPSSSGMLFLDEINQGHQAVQKALFQLVLDRKIGNLKMNDDWGIVAAGNLGADFNEPLPIALTSRFKAGIMVADAPTWLKWARMNNISEYICEFVEIDPEKNFYEKPSFDNQFACPRSFVTLSEDMEEIYKDFKASNGKLSYDPMTEIEIAAGESCGPAWSRRFMAHLRYMRHFDWDKLVSNPKKHIGLKKNTKETEGVSTDQLHGVLSRCTSELQKRLMGADKKTQIKVAAEMCGILHELDEEWMNVFFSKLNRVDNMITATLFKTILDNKNVEPFKSFMSKDWTRAQASLDKGTK